MLRSTPTLIPRIHYETTPFEGTIYIAFRRDLCGKLFDVFILRLYTFQSFDRVTFPRTSNCNVFIDYSTLLILLAYKMFDCLTYFRGFSRFWFNFLESIFKGGTQENCWYFFNLIIIIINNNLIVKFGISILINL